MPGFLDLLTKAQCYRVDDQRGLLTKEQLEIPLFLQQSLKQGQGDTKPDEASAASSSTADSKDDIKEEETTSTQSSAGGAEKTPDSAQSEPKDLKETAV